MRRQDGTKLPLLCQACEELFAADEEHFAREIFVPFHEHPSPAIEYGAWALRFAASVAWRIVTWDALERTTPLSAPQAKAVGRALQAWKAYLVATASHPAEFEIHLYGLDMVRPEPGRWTSPLINRYLHTSVDAHVIVGRSDVLAFAKMCSLLVIGLIKGSNGPLGHDSQLHVRRGTFRHPSIISDTIASYLNWRAEVMFRGETLSEKQAEKVEDALVRRFASGADSRWYDAAKQDAAFFGAFDGMDSSAQIERLRAKLAALQ